MNDIILENRGPGRFEATLYHDIVCRIAKKCFCRVKGTKMTAKGAKPNKAPTSFSIDQRAKSSPLPRFVLHIPQVKLAMKSGQLVLHEVPTAPKPPPKPKAPKKPAEE